MVLVVIVLMTVYYGRKKMKRRRQKETSEESISFDPESGYVGKAVGGNRMHREEGCTAALDCARTLNRFPSPFSVCGSLGVSLPISSPPQRNRTRTRNYSLNPPRSIIQLVRYKLWKSIAGWQQRRSIAKVIRTNGFENSTGTDLDDTNTSVDESEGREW